MTDPGLAFVAGMAVIVLSMSVLLWARLMRSTPASDDAAILRAAAATIGELTPPDAEFAWITSKLNEMADEKEAGNDKR